MNDKNRINHLFTRLLDNSISKEELDQLLKYVHKSEKESEIKEWMDKHWDVVNMHLKDGDPEILNDGRFEAILSKLDRGPEKIQRRKEVAKRLHINSLQWIGIAASICILISVGIYWYVGRSTNSDMSQTTQMASVNYSGKQFVQLPDGSTVVLNEGSELSYNETFGNKTREVSLDGEGYFDIVHDSGRPFIVHTGDVKTTVLGTAFNLTAYRDQSDVVVTVTRGKVSVGDKDHEYEKILPKQQLVVHKKTRKYEKEEVDLDQVLAWKENFLILDGMTIGKAAEMIGMRHHVKIAIGNNKIINCKISAAFMKGESLEQILRVVCGVLQADFTIDGDTVFIKGGRECE